MRNGTALILGALLALPGVTVGMVSAQRAHSSSPPRLSYQPVGRGVGDDLSTNALPPSSSLPCNEAARPKQVGRAWGREALVEAIAHVESNGDSAAVGDGGRAVGILQIHPITVRDCNRILGREEFTLTCRLDPERSRLMFEVYTDHYSKNADAQTIARRWNGGPDGDTEPATVEYWRKVKAALDEQARTKAGVAGATAR